MAQLQRASSALRWRHPLQHSCRRALAPSGRALRFISSIPTGSATGSGPTQGVQPQGFDAGSRAELLQHLLNLELPVQDDAASFATFDATLQNDVGEEEEDFVLNHDFFGKYKTLPSMAKATSKEDIIMIVDNFALIRRRHHYLLQRLTTTVIADIENWSAPELSQLCRSLLELNFLREDLCIAMAGRVRRTAHSCSPSELCWLFDAYASTRCSVQSVTETVARETLNHLQDFRIDELARHASSFARLEVAAMEDILVALARQATSKLQGANLSPAVPGHFIDRGFVARDLSIAAYAFSRLHSSHECDVQELFRALCPAAMITASDFTAKDLQVLLVALARVNHRDEELLHLLASKALWRLAQFDAESLALTLRALAFHGMGAHQIFLSTICHLPRYILHFRPADVATLLNAFAAAQVHSEALFDIVTPHILEKAPMFTSQDWHLAQRAYASLKHEDPHFKAAFAIHCKS